MIEWIERPGYDELVDELGRAWRVHWRRPAGEARITRDGHSVDWPRAIWLTRDNARTAVACMLIRERSQRQKKTPATLSTSPARLNPTR